MCFISECRSMCAANKSSLEVSYGHLGDVNPLLAIWLTDIPRDMIMIFDEVLKELVLKEFSNYTEVCVGVSVRACLFILLRCIVQFALLQCKSSMFMFYLQHCFLMRNIYRCADCCLFIYAFERKDCQGCACPYRLLASC